MNIHTNNILNYQQSYYNNNNLAHYNATNFNGRILPQKYSEKYCNATYKMIFSPIYDYKTRKFPPVIKKFINKVDIPMENGSMYAWELNPQNSENYILFLHGIKGSVPIPANQILLDTLNKKGYGVIAPEYRGTGSLHKDAFNCSSIIEDSRATLNYLKDKGIKPENITILSHCIGSIPASVIASEEPNIHKLVLASPFLHGDELGTTLLKYSGLKLPQMVTSGINKLISLFVPYDLKTSQAIKKSNVPVQVIIPEHDHIVSLEQAQQFCQDMPNLENIVTIPDGHSLIKRACRHIANYF